MNRHIAYAVKRCGNSSIFRVPQMRVQYPEEYADYQERFRLLSDLQCIVDTSIR